MMSRDLDSARARHEAKVAERAGSVLSDERFPGLRTRRSRSLLVVAMGSTIVATPVAWLAGGPLWGLAVVVAAFGVLCVLRYSIRVIDDLHDHVLDERQLGARDRAYVEAYRWFVGISAILASIGLFVFVVNADDADVWAVELTWDMVMAGYWVLVLAALAAPSMVVALADGNEPTVDPSS